MTELKGKLQIEKGHMSGIRTIALLRIIAITILTQSLLLTLVFAAGCGLLNTGQENSQESAEDSSGVSEEETRRLHAVKAQE